MNWLRLVLVLGLWFAAVVNGVYEPLWLGGVVAVLAGYQTFELIRDWT